MTTNRYANYFKFLLVSAFLGGCQAVEFSQLTPKPTSFLAQIIKPKDSAGKYIQTKANSEQVEVVSKTESLGEVLSDTLADKNTGSDFASAMKYALNSDPKIILQRRDVDAKLASIGYTEAQKDFQVTSTIYGGIEDITDNTKGIAVSLNASRLLYDGGLIDAQVDAARYAAEAAKFRLVATINERALRFGTYWIELEKYQTLQKKIDSRLAVLDPLIEQLEKVADAGLGDLSKVTAAQRTVATIRVAETNIAEGLAQAKLDFLNAFGELEFDIAYDVDFVSGLLPSEVNDDLAETAPLLLSLYSDYKASLTKVASIEAKDGFNVGFEARAMRPFAGSAADSDESFGLVARKTLFNSKTIDSEKEEAVSRSAAISEEIRATYREGVRAIRTSQQNIASMDKAIVLARKNAEITAEEIIYLKQQLIIGGSTLDSVLSAEARLYEAEAKEINFLAEKRKSQLTIASALGLLSSGLEL